MDKVPLVSILCGCYNQSKFVVESLESIKSQTFKDYEVIIWDDASKDDSVSIIEQWILQNPSLTIQFVKHTINQGVCKSLNESFRLSKGKYIQMLALDDILMPDKIERQVKILEKSDDSFALVFSDVNLINEKSELFSDETFTQFRRDENVKTKSINFYERLLNFNFLMAMSVLLKREVIEDVGLWDENLTYEDYDMWLRISQKYNFIYDFILSVKYRVHENNFHRQTSLHSKSSFDIYIKHDHVIARRKIYELLMFASDYQNLWVDHKAYYKKFDALNLKDKILSNYYSFLCYRYVLGLKVKLHKLIKT